MDLRQLNRASLRRQLLLDRADSQVESAVEQIGGLQAQAPNAPYVGLWSRLRDFRPTDLAEALQDRRLVRTTLQRATIHLVTAADAVAWYPLIRPVMARGFATNFGRRLPDVDLTELVDAATTLLADRPSTRVELGQALAARWPGRDTTALAQAATCLVPVVQVPPRGIWGSTGKAAWQSTPTWLPGTHPAPATPDDLVLRGLAAFGPATVRDLQTWCGLTRLREVTDCLGAQLRTYSGEHGATLFDLPDAELPDPDTPAPPRFLPEYDNLLLSYADRARVGADHRAVPLPPGIGGVAGSVLVDGFWRADWRLRRDGDTATLVVEPFDRLPRRDVAEVTAEGRRLLGFIAPDAERNEVVCTPSSVRSR
jgi:hypothetical protein